MGYNPAADTIIYTIEDPVADFVLDDAKDVTHSLYKQLQQVLVLMDSIHGKYL